MAPSPSLDSPAAPVRPAIAVLLPVYNAVDTVAAAIASILAQTEPRFELLAIDDGSTDATPALLAAAAAGDPRVRVLRLPHGGIVAALNAGIAATDAPLVARMDADDLCHPERLARQRALFDADPALGLVACRVAYGGDRAAQAGYARYVDWANSLLTDTQIRLGQFIESPFAHPSVMFRRALVAEHGGYRDGDFPEDYELWLRWLAAGVTMAKVDAELLVWNDPPGRLSRTDRRYATRAFHATKAGYLAAWLRTHNPQHPAVWIWGAGRPTRKRASELEAHGIQIVGYIDVDPTKIGRPIHGRPVVGPDTLPPADSSCVVSYVANAGARDEIAAALEARGFIAGVSYILAG